MTDKLALLDASCRESFVETPGASMEARLRELESQVAELAGATPARQGMTIIVFSGDMDKLMTAFMLATDAAALGIPVFMYFVFWGLAAVRKGNRVRGKGLLDRMLSAMLGSGPGSVGLSKWNLLGLGRPVFDRVLRLHHVEPLGNLILLARELGVRMVVCQTAMEVMGVKREELLDGVEFGGVTTVVDAAQNSATTLFI